MKLSSLALTLLLADSSASASPSLNHGRHVAFVSQRPATPSTKYGSVTALSSSANAHCSFAAIDAAARQASDAAEQAMAAADSIPLHSKTANQTRRRPMFAKSTATAAAATVASASTPFAAMALSPDASYDALHQVASPALASSSVLLNYADMVGSFQLLYTAALVAGVGYTQRMAGREDFKKEMATKIASGEITPEELVDEIKVMAEEINQSAGVAVSAKLEVQKILDETKAIATMLTESSGGKLDVAEGVSQLRSDYSRDTSSDNAIKPEVDITVEKSVPSQEDMIPEPISLATEDEIIEEATMKDDTDLIAEALLATPPSLRFSAEKENIPLEDHEDVSRLRSLAEDANQAEIARLDTTNRAKEEQNLAVEMQTEIRQKAEAIRASIKSSSPSMEIKDKATNNSDEDVSNALKLAEEAVISASGKGSSTDKSPALEEPFVPPVPPNTPPPLELVMESVGSDGIELEAPTKKSQPEIKVVMGQKSKAKVSSTGPVRSSPLARVLAGQYGIDIEDVAPGSGLKGRVVADDVRAYAEMMEMTV